MTPVCAVDGCDRPTRDGVCSTCAATLSRDLGDVPAYRADLEVSLSRQSVSGDRNGGRSANKPLPYDVGASEVLSVLRSTLVGWVRMAVEEDAAPWPADTLDAMAGLLLARVEWLRHHPAGPEACDEIGAALTLARRAVDRRQERVYAGPCDETPDGPGGRCDGELYARPTSHTVVCPKCRVEHDVAARREWLRASTEGHLGTATEISALSRHMLGELVTSAMIRGYAYRGAIAPHGAVTDGRGREVPLYRLGDVFAAAASAAADPRSTRNARRDARDAEQARRDTEHTEAGVA